MRDMDDETPSAPELMLDSLPKRQVAHLVGSVVAQRASSWPRNGSVEEFQQRAQRLPAEIRNHMDPLPEVGAADNLFERLVTYLEDLAADDFASPGARGQYIEALDRLSDRINERIGEWREETAALNRFLQRNLWPPDEP